MSSPITTVVRSIDIPTDGDTASLKFAISCDSVQTVYTITVHKRDAEKIVSLGETIHRTAKNIRLGILKAEPLERDCEC